MKQLAQQSSEESRNVLVHTVLFCKQVGGSVAHFRMGLMSWDMIYKILFVEVFSSNFLCPLKKGQGVDLLFFVRLSVSRKEGAATAAGQSG